MPYVGRLNHSGSITTDKYEFFEFNKMNRIIDPEIIHDLENDFCENIGDKDYPFEAPVVVYYQKGMKSAIILQGHHRVMVCMQQGRNINYVIANNLRSPSISQQKRHQDWKTEDLVYSYSEELILDYQILYRLKQENKKYSLIALTVMLNGKVTNVDNIREKKFKIENSESKEDAYDIATDRIKKYEQFLKASRRNDRSKELIKCIIEAIDNKSFKWDYFISRCEINSHEINTNYNFRSISTSAKAKALIEKLYNTNSRKHFYF